MFDDYFFRVDDRREIDRLIPLNEMSKIAHELIRMGFRDCQPKFLYGASTWNNYVNQQMRSRHSRVGSKDLRAYPSRVRLAEHYLDRIRPCTFQGLRGEEKLPLV